MFGICCFGNTRGEESKDKVKIVSSHNGVGELSLYCIYENVKLYLYDEIVLMTSL